MMAKRDVLSSRTIGPDGNNKSLGKFRLDDSRSLWKGMGGDKKDTI